MKFKELLGVLDPDEMYSIYIYDKELNNYDSYEHEYTAKGKSHIHTQYDEREVVQIDLGTDSIIRICLK